MQVFSFEQGGDWDSEVNKKFTKHLWLFLLRSGSKSVTILILCEDWTLLGTAGRRMKCVV